MLISFHHNPFTLVQTRQYMGGGSNNNTLLQSLFSNATKLNISHLQGFFLSSRPSSMSNNRQRLKFEKKGYLVFILQYFISWIDIFSCFMISQESIQFHWCDIIDLCINQDLLVQLHVKHFIVIKSQNLNWMYQRIQSKQHPVALKSQTWLYNHYHILNGS